MQSHVPPPAQAGEITIQDLERQDSEQELTRSNWRIFIANPEPSPPPGSGRTNQPSKEE